mmetsp:Transcript_9863/g.14095  ORF Transcript_9863/g.14095 Transcript_9863/m.14095 type:complete len:266 (-) Transcript_9863:1041-1838(-)
MLIVGIAGQNHYMNPSTSGKGGIGLFNAFIALLSMLPMPASLSTGMSILSLPLVTRVILTILRSSPLNPSDSASLAMSTMTSSPSLRNSRMMASLRVSSRYRLAARRIGLAPNCAALKAPSCVTIAVRVGVTVTSMSCSAEARPTVSSRIPLAIEMRTSSSSGLKTTISSIRFKSSGFIFFSSSFLTAPSIDMPALDPSSAVGFSPREIWIISLLPTLDVMTKIQFLNETVRPFPSVKVPSSRICNRMLSTSSCAFSNSSNSTTE